MKNKVLKAMCKCRDLTRFDLRNVVLDDGYLFATDQYVALAYTEDWALPCGLPRMAVPEEWVLDSKPNTLVRVTEEGFEFDSPEFKAAVGKPCFDEVHSYPTNAIKGLLNDFEEHGLFDGETVFDSKRIKQVNDVLIAADMSAKWMNCGSTLKFRALKFDRGHLLAECFGVVMGMRVK